jgi:hypothetical protein
METTRTIFTSKMFKPYTTKISFNHYRKIYGLKETFTLNMILSLRIKAKSWKSIKN